MLIVRKAIHADASALAELGIQTVRETYTHDSPEDQQQFIAARFSPEIQTKELETPGSLMLVAEKSAQMVGYAYVGPCKLPLRDSSEDKLELQRIYVLKTEQGLGVGAALMEQIIAFSDAKGKKICLGLWDGNHQALKFYQKFGFSKVGSYLLNVGATQETQAILMR